MTMCSSPPLPVASVSPCSMRCPRSRARLSPFAFTALTGPIANSILPPAKACAEVYVASRARLGFPLLPKHLQAQAVAAYRANEEAGVNAAATAAARAVAPHAEEIPHAS